MALLDVKAALARIDARRAEVARLLQGQFPAGLMGDAAKLTLLQEAIALTGAKLDLITEFANNREVTPAAVVSTITMLKNQRAVITMWLAVPLLAGSATNQANLRSQDAALATLQTRAEVLLKYLETQTPTPAERDQLPSSLTNPQGVSLATLDALQRTQDLKTLAIIGVVGAVGYIMYRRGTWKL